MSVDLKSCPFCGNKSVSIMRNSEFDCWNIQCDLCHGAISKSDVYMKVSFDEHEVDIDCIEEDATDYYIQGKIKGLEPLIMAWNTRHEPMEKL